MSSVGTQKVWWLISLATLLFLGIPGCKSDGETPESEGAESTATGGEAGGEDDSESGDDGDDEQASGEGPPADVYPRIKFDVLSGEERRKTVDIAKSELCPCPDANTSLHGCLVDLNKQCQLARRAAAIIAEGVRTGRSRDDVQDRLAEFTEEAKRKREFDLEGVAHKGPSDAPVRVVEFADFECPACKRASDWLKKVVGEYDDQVSLYFRHYPVSHIHPDAEMAARAAEAARRQGKFWAMHNLLFENQRNLSKDKIEGFARQIGLNFGKFKKDFASQEVADAVQKDLEVGKSAGVQGTPTIFVNGSKLQKKNEEGLRAAIERALDDDKDKPKQDKQGKEDDG